jgi:hypothetical protein
MYHRYFNLLAALAAVGALVTNKRQSEMPD